MLAKVDALAARKSVDRDGKITGLFKEAAMSQAQQEKAWAAISSVMNQCSTNAECEVHATPPLPSLSCATRHHLPSPPPLHDAPLLHVHVCVVVHHIRWRSRRPSMLLLRRCASARRPTAASRARTQSCSTSWARSGTSMASRTCAHATPSHVVVTATWAGACLGGCSHTSTR